MNPSLLFSSYEYYKNYAFTQLTRNWTKYVTLLESGTEDIALLFEWRELLMKDWYERSTEWLNNNRHPQNWGEGLE